MCGRAHPLARIADAQNNQIRLELPGSFKYAVRGRPESHSGPWATPNLRALRNDFVELMHGVSRGILRWLIGQAQSFGGGSSSLGTSCVARVVNVAQTATMVFLRSSFSPRIKSTMSM